MNTGAAIGLGVFSGILFIYAAVVTVLLIKKGK